MSMLFVACIEALSSCYNKVWSECHHPHRGQIHDSFLLLFPEYLKCPSFHLSINKHSLLIEVLLIYLLLTKPKQTLPGRKQILY